MQLLRKFLSVIKILELNQMFANISFVAVGRTASSPRAPSPKTTQRRTLPRPSQASSNLRYTSSRLSNSPAQSRIAKTITSPRAPSPAQTQADLWGDDEVY